MKKLITICAAFAMLLYGSSTGLAGPSYLGSAQDFAVLGAAGVTNTGDTTIYGNLGVDPIAYTAITGFGPGVVTGGSIYGPGDPSYQARLDATTAYNTLAGLSGTTLSAELGGLTLAPGVYKFDSSAQLTGTLTLDFTSNPGGDFVFQIGSTLTTASSSIVDVIGGSSLSGVYWVVGSSATLGSGTVFAGNILADQSISFDSTAAILCGRAFALTGSVTLIDNQISNNNTLEDFDSDREDFGSHGFSGGVIPAPAAILLGGIGVSLVGWLRRRRTL